MSGTPDILQKIIAHKRSEIAAASAHTTQDELLRRIEDAPPPRGFLERLDRNLAGGRAAVIAELKKASPSKGVLREDYDPAAIAASYEAGGAACLSVLTDREYFHGEARHLVAARAACALPVLRKDFLLDPWQVYEARAIGADCVLLIVAALDDKTLDLLYRAACGAGMDVLVEVHDRGELERALALEGGLIGINNRDLHSFETRLQTTLDMMEWMPPHCTVITESGIHAAADVRLMRDNGVHGFLVGEALMRAPDPGVRLRELFGGGSEQPDS